MLCNPAVLLNRQRPKPKVSVILIDWKARESFHSLDYLSRQTVNRADYELIWVEFYDHRPRGLARKADALDKWIVCGYPDNFIYHKHRLYNVGILAAEGEVCVICDSDAIFRPTFIESLVRAFEEDPESVVHLDEVRNNSSTFYPFRYPTIEEVLGAGCINWTGAASDGLATQDDRIHRANYGACMAARRNDLLGVGGADEHLDYLGYICGPYDLTFRLANYQGRPERWLEDEYLYHVWHPNASGFNTEYHGGHDGAMMSLRALDAQASFRIKPFVPSPLMNRAWRRNRPGLDEVVSLFEQSPEPDWQVGAQTADPSHEVYWVERDFLGFNIFWHAEEWFALPVRAGRLDARRAERDGYQTLLQGETQPEIHGEIVRHLLASRRALAGPLDWLLRGLSAEPIARLPYRLWRKARQILSRVKKPCPPWQPTRPRDSMKGHQWQNRSLSRADSGTSAASSASTCSAPASA